MKKTNLLKLVIAISLPLAVGAIAGLFSAEAIPAWYASLSQPSFNPPNWLFGPVWTILYITMVISLYLVWKSEPAENRNKAIVIFLVQLTLNFFWSFLFFYFKNLGLALAEIILLWISIATIIVTFHKVKPFTAYMNVPYLLWVSFATVLNAAYFFLN